MAYADVAAVKARAGALARAWTDTSEPANSDIADFLEEEAALINALLASRGVSPPADGSDAAVALRDLNAEAALVRALVATYPEGATAEIAEARASVKEQSQQLLAGTHPAIALLEAATSAPHASSFWQEEGDSFGVTATADSRDTNPFTSAGPIGRGQRF